MIGTPGPLRLFLEFGLYGVAVAGAWLVWPVWIGAIAALIVIVSLITGSPRAKWLLEGSGD